MFNNLSEKLTTKETIVYFDGLCGICNGFVDFVLRINKDSSLKFAPLQGQTAALHLPIEATKDLKTIVFQKNGTTYSKSRAVIEILAASGGLWSLAPILRIVPAFVRDALYDLVAKNRYRLAGKKEECRIPTPQERARFLS